jgi:hypothetical protein
MILPSYNHNLLLSPFPSFLSYLIFSFTPAIFPRKPQANAQPKKKVKKRKEKNLKMTNSAVETKTIKGQNQLSSKSLTQKNMNMESF